MAIVWGGWFNCLVKGRVMLYWKLLNLGLEVGIIRGVGRVILDGNWFFRVWVKWLLSWVRIDIMDDDVRGSEC